MKKLKKLSEIDDPKHDLRVSTGLERLTRIDKAHRSVFSHMSNKSSFINKMIAGN